MTRRHNRVSVVRVQVLRTGDPHNRYWCLVPVSASPARERTITWLQKNHWKLETGVQSMLKGTYHTQTLISIPNGQAGRCTRVSNGFEIPRGLPKAQPASSATRTTGKKAKQENQSSKLLPVVW